MKTFVTTITLVLVSFVLFYSCNQSSSTQKLVGTWQRTDVKSVELTMTLSMDSTWAFLRNGQVIDAGIFDINNNQLILKHEDCNNDHDHNHEGHQHHHHEDHIYTFSFANRQEELHLESEGITTYFKRL